MFNQVIGVVLIVVSISSCCVFEAKFKADEVKYYVENGYQQDKGLGGLWKRPDCHEDAQ